MIGPCNEPAKYERILQPEGTVDAAELGLPMKLRPLLGQATSNTYREESD